MYVQSQDSREVGLTINVPEDRDADEVLSIISEVVACNSEVVQSCTLEAGRTDSNEVSTLPIGRSSLLQLLNGCKVARFRRISFGTDDQETLSNLKLDLSFEGLNFRNFF